MELWLRRQLWLCCLQGGGLLLCFAPAQDLDLHCTPKSFHAEHQVVRHLTARSFHTTMILRAEPQGSTGGSCYDRARLRRVLDVGGLPPPRLALSRLALLIPATCSRASVRDVWKNCAVEAPADSFSYCKQEVFPSTREPTPCLRRAIRPGVLAALSIPCKNQHA